MTAEKDNRTIRITKKGPYIVSGGIPLSKQRIVCNRQGESIRWQECESYPTKGTYALCRCGGSQNKPFCDGAHLKISFDGTETSSRVPYLERAEWVEGKDIKLSDAPGFCSHARFCIRGRGIWDLVEQQQDPVEREVACEEIAKCHSGRLILWDKKTGDPLEPILEKTIGVVEGPGEGIEGPLWVRGGIPVISADGFLYEIRNRVTLCRCGKSANKPFCDGRHLQR